MVKSTRIINVVFLVHGLDVGGAEKMLINIVNGLDRMQFHPIVVSLSPYNPLQSELADGTSLKVFTRRWRYDLHPALQIRHLMLKNDADCVVCFDFYTFFFARLALLGYPKTAPKVLISQHTTIARDMKEYWQSLFYGRLLRKEDHIITVCRNQTDYLSATYRIPQMRFVTIYNGVDVEFFSPEQVQESDEAIRDRLRIPLDVNVILHVANFSTTKRHEDILSAFRILTEHNPELRSFYVSVGGGNSDREQKIRELAINRGLMDKILFAGIRDDVRPFYKIAACTCLSSASETFSITSLEAMAMGIPVVLTDVGGADEMVVNGFNGFLVPPKKPEVLAKALAKAIKEKHRFNKNDIRHQVTEHFSLQKCIERYANLLKGDM